MGYYPLFWTIAGFGDFDGGGKTDILWRNQTTGDIYVWLMNGFSVAGEWYAGAVGSVWQVAGTPNLAGDATSDILWINTASGSVAAWLGSPNGFTDHTVFATVGGGWLPMPTLN